MSTVKTDAIVAVSTNADLSLDGIGTGGVSIASTLKMTKGGDISSASPLVIDVDGNYFDVTGTTNFAAMTVESGNFFMLQFDGALTITHGSGIELPGAANLTTATGDRLICYATAANTVEVMSVELETAASAGGGTLGTEAATTSGTSVTISGIASGTKLIFVTVEGVSFDGSTAELLCQIGDTDGVETSGYVAESGGINSTSPSVTSSTAGFIAKGLGAAGLWGGTFILSLKDSSNFTWACSGVLRHATTSMQFVGGTKSLSAELTSVTLARTATNDFDAGSFNILTYG
jgi:hypothetical protein